MEQLDHMEWIQGDFLVSIFCCICKRSETIWRCSNISVQTWEAFPYQSNWKKVCVSKNVDMAGGGGGWWRTQNLQAALSSAREIWGGGMGTPKPHHFANSSHPGHPMLALPLCCTDSRAFAHWAGLGAAAAEKQPARRKGESVQCVLEWAVGISNYGNWCQLENTSRYGFCKPQWIEEHSTGFWPPSLNPHPWFLILFSSISSNSCASPWLCELTHVVEL